MGKLVLKKPVIIIDGTDLTKRARSLTIDMPDDEVDLSTFGSQFKETGKGLSDASMVVDFLQDYAAGMVDAVLWPLKENDEPFQIAAKPTEAVASPTNPQFAMQALMYNYSPLAGAVGEAVSSEVTFKNASDEGVEKITEEGKEIK
jgi:hypothetical protein